MGSDENALGIKSMSVTVTETVQPAYRCGKCDNIVMLCDSEPVTMWERNARGPGTEWRLHRWCGHVTLVKM